MPVVLALTPDGRWDTDTPGLVEATRDAGFVSLGVAADRADARTAGLLRQAGLGCHELLALVLSDDEIETLASASRLARAATMVGARWVLTTFRSGLTSATAPIIERCASMFAEAGAGMAVEFSPLGPVSSIRVGMEIVEAAGAGRAGLMIDSWHFSFGDSTWEDLAGVPLESIAYLQFTDALAPESDRLGRETMNRRAPPGEGVLELGRFATIMRDRGYEGVVSVEVLSSALRELPVHEAVRRLYQATAPYWT